jgi:hypothetical protein
MEARVPTGGEEMQGPTASPLQAYLNRQFPAELWAAAKSGAAAGRGENADEEAGGAQGKEGRVWRDKDLMEHFFTLYGVNVFTEGSIFYQFKYEMCLTENWNEEVKEARGIIFERRTSCACAPDGCREPSDSGWVIVGRPFEKFFNQQEAECPVANAKVFDANCSAFGMAEKADGTCIQFWWSSPATLDAVYEAALQMEAAGALAIRSDEDMTNGGEGEEEIVMAKHAGSEALVSDESSSEATTAQQGLGKASLIEKRARRFKKVLPRVLQATADSQQQQGEEAPKHARGLVRKPQHYHVQTYRTHRSE